MKPTIRSFPVFPLDSRRGWLAASALLGASLAALPAQAQFQRSGGNPFAPPNATRHYPRSRDYDLKHMKVVFNINAADHSAQGVVTHTLTPMRDTLKTIVMDAGANLKIEAVSVNGEPATFDHKGEVLTITAPITLRHGQDAAVAIRYTMPGNGPSGGLMGTSGFHWIDPRPEDPDRVASFWTQGETDGNHHWVPCYDFPNDKCTSETITTVPETWTIIGNGTESPVTHNVAAKTKTYHWTMTQPHSTYLLSLVGGELDVRKDVWRGVPLYYAVPKGKASLIPASFGNTPDMLSFFSDTLGVKYPWSKYAQNAMFDFGGGMENVSATTLGERSLVDSRSGHFPMSSLDSHELGHQWFGDLVTCRDWGDVWLNESFATFMETIYMEHLEGKDQYDQERANNLRAYLFEATRYKRPISTSLYASPDSMFDSHTYPKGGLVLHMLRRELGDTDFYHALGYYLNKNRYQPVDAHDLSKAIDEATGHNVDAFFDQWIFKPGHPVLDAAWTYDDAGKAVVLKVKQTQDTTNGTPIYTLPLAVALLSGGSGTAQMTRQTVTLNSAEQEFRMAADAKPDALLIDPDHDLLKDVKDNHWDATMLPVILRSAPSYLDRVAAARQMLKDGADETKAQIITQAVEAEKSDHAAAGMLQAAGNEKSEAFRALFRDQIKSKAPSRRGEAVIALGKLPVGPEDTALLRPLAMSDTEPYAVVESAMQALGGTDAPKNLDVFQHQVRVKSLNDRLAGTVVEILARSKASETAPVLIEATAPTHATRTRVGAIEGLAEVAPASAPVHSALLTLLNEDDKPRIQTAAVNALRSRKDKEALTALRALSARTKNDELKRAAAKSADEIEGK